MDFCVLVAAAIGFVPIGEELGETGSLGGLGKLFKAEIEVMDDDRVFCRKSYLGELVLIFSYRRAVGTDALTLLWCTLEF